MSVKLLTEHHLEFLSLKGGCTGWSESTLVKMPHYWKSQVMAQLYCSCLHFRIYIVHDEVKDKNFELELSWVGESK